METKEKKNDVKEIMRVKVSDEESYNAFTSMVFYNDLYWIAYRNGTGHVSPFGKIIIRTSVDGKVWKRHSVLEKDGIDLRDPRLKILNGQMVLSCFSLKYWDKIKIKYESHDSFIYIYNEKDDEFNLVHQFDYGKYHTILWDTAFTHGNYYLGGYFFEGAKSIAKIWKSSSLEGPWELATTIDDSVLPPNLCYNEFDMILEDFDTMTLFLRVDTMHFKRIKNWKKRWVEKLKRVKNENTSKNKPYKTRGFNDFFVVAHSKFPFTNWEYKLHRVCLKGPRAIYHPSGKYFFVGRFKEKRNSPRGSNKITLFQYEREKAKFEALHDLAQGKDGSYAGLLLKDDDPSLLHVSFYSDHERINTKNDRKVNDIWYSQLKLI